MGAGKIQNGLVVPDTCDTVTSRHDDRWERSLDTPPPTIRAETVLHPSN
jgi:hypothetical protein